MQTFPKWHPSRAFEPGTPKHHCRRAGTFSIYLLIDPRDQTARYAGITARDPKLRLEEHCTAPHRNSRLRAWLAGLAQAGLKPALVVVGRVAANKWQSAERSWIKWLRDNGGCYNIQNGGLSPWGQQREPPPPRKPHYHDGICARKKAKPHLVGRIDSLGIYRQNVIVKKGYRAKLRDVLAGKPLPVPRRVNPG